MDGQEPLPLVMPRPAWTSGTSFCSSALFLSSAFLILAPAAPSPFSPWRPSWGSVSTLWWWGMLIVRQRDAGCQASASQSQLVQSSKRLWVKVPLSTSSQPGVHHGLFHPQVGLPVRRCQPGLSLQSTLPPWAAVSDSFSSPVEPLGLGKQSCQPAHLISLQPPAASVSPPRRQCHLLCRAPWELPLQLGSIQGFKLSLRAACCPVLKGPCFWLPL